MWSNPRPPSRTSPGDHYNNNPATTNPYSRTAAVPRGKPGRTSADPWDWGWDENSAQQQDDWNNGWSQPPAPAPNVIPNPPPSFYHPSKPDNKSHGTPDLIPEKVNRGNAMPPIPQQHYNQISNASDFFENIDLVAQNHQAPPLPSMYRSPDIGRPPQQPSVPPNYPMYQNVRAQHTANRHPSSVNYFQQPNLSHPVNNEPMPYYQPPVSRTPNMYQQPQYYQPPEVTNQSFAPEHSNSYFNQSQAPASEHGNYFDQNAFMNSTDTSYQPTNTVEVENIEVPVASSPEKTVTPAHHSEPSNIVEAAAEETNIPDNQETVPDNEEHIQGLPQKMSQMKINSTHNLETWNNSPGWENQEVAPRCELDRNQYLETGQLDSNDHEETPPETDNNDEGEALPPPGLHRMVTGQGPESISQRSVLGQLPSASHSNGSGFVRLVPGQPTPRGSPEPTSLERLVPGQQNIEDISSQRMVPGQQSQDSQGPQRFTSQEQPEELQRLIPGQTQNEPMGARMIPGQLSDDENNVGTGDMERMIPGGLSERENSFSGDVPDDERMVPGGMSDDSRSQSISMDDETRNSSERHVPGMNEMNASQLDNQSERRVTGAGSSDHLDQPVISQDGARHRNGTAEPVNQPPPGLHRLVLGQINSEASTDAQHTSVKTAERGEDSSGSTHPPGMHRMVVGQFREKEPDIENDKEKEPVKSSNDRDDDSDSDYNRSERRRQRHRKDSYDDERRERDYSSEREHRGRREDRRDHRKKRDNSFNQSPEYRSDHEDYDYRDRRDKDRRDRARDRERDRRRRSPDSSYDPYYRDDPRKLPPRDPRDRRYYEPYEDDPYYYRENRSRPSSRSGSEYRRHRDYPPRQPYYPDQGGMSNWHYYQMQQFYENMRRNDPQAYALWYERYMAEKFGSASNDRASVHSGRSSANDNSRLNENEEEEREDVKADDTVSHRSTPQLYSSAHIRGQFNSVGQLVVVNPHDPFSYGQHQATVTLCKVAGPNAADTPDTLEFLQNPGPFISGTTHKNTVLQYLKKQADQSSHSSEKLLYELIRLVIKLNGVVDMTDVADLLIVSYRNSKTESNNFEEVSPEVDSSPPLSPHQITKKFRDLLLEGNKTEALEWAMKNKDWGHALFLASKMDSRTHNNVMLRFANGLQNNDPLQTLYQLMSGREPQAATCAADKKWGDWRPHLAMMLSNRTADIELDRKAILTLGDSLGARGRLYASHFCYLTAQLEFSNYSDRQAKLVLLGASPDRPFNQFASCRAIMLTLCYEYAKQLSNKEWCIPTLRPYKFLLACRLFDHANLPAALAYLESLAQEIVRLPARDDKPLTQLVIDMADRIKCAESSLAFVTDPSSDPDWLSRLKMHLEETSDPNYLSSHLTHGVSTSTVSDLEPVSYNGEQHIPQPAVPDTNLAYSHEVAGNTNENSYMNSYQESYYNPSQNNYYNPAQAVQNSHELQQTQGYDQYQPVVDNSSNDYWSGQSWNQQNTIADPQVESTPQVESQPQISVKPGFGYFENSEEHIRPQLEKSAPHPEKSQIKEKPNRRADKTQQGGSGWFGGIWERIARKPSNQMKLPDDKNPAIVWDEKTKRWVNTDGSEEEQVAQLKPPPKASDLNGSAPVPSMGPAPAVGPSLAPPGSEPSGLPPPAVAPTANKYKLQRGKGARSNYVDVMGSNTKPVTASATNPQSFGALPQQPPVTNFFVPAPVPGNENAPVDFVSPSGPISFEHSTSKSDDQPPPGGYAKGNPAFYKPASYK